MLKATIEVEVTTSTNEKRSDPYNWWSVRLISKSGDDIRNILEQDFSKNQYDKAEAANQMIENVIVNLSDLVYGDS